MVIGFCLIFLCCMLFVFFFFKQNTAYEMRISDWSSDVCSSDLPTAAPGRGGQPEIAAQLAPVLEVLPEQLAGQAGGDRSEERRVGKECVSTCRSRCSPVN